MAELPDETLEVTFSGLFTSSNPFSKAPPGAAEVADNVVIRNPSLVQPRRGYTATTASPSGAISRTFPWMGRIIAFHVNGDIRDFSDATGWSSVYTASPSQSFAPPDAANPIRATSAAQSLFWTTSKGLSYVDGLGSSALPAGLQAPVLFSINPGAPTTSPIANGSSCGYRAVLCRYDANGHLVQSAPSDLFIFDNASGAPAAAQISLIFPIPSRPSTAYLMGCFVQLYRTFQLPTGQALQDECYLVQEYTLRTADATAAGCILPYDQQTDAALAIPLYTNAATGGSLAVANGLPPLARDLCFFNSYLLAINTTERHTLSLQLIGTQGLVSGVSSFTLAGVTFTAATSPSGNFQFKLSTGGTAAQNIEKTARSIVQTVNFAINQYGGNIVAYYTSSPKDPPGKMTFQEIGVGGTAFTFAAGQDGQVVWSPDCSLAALVQTSTNTRKPGRLWYSNQGQPWGFSAAAGSYIDIAAVEQDALRILVIRQTAFIFKKDGLYTLTLGGTSGAPFSVQPFDPGLVLLAPESAAVVNDRIHCYTNRGAVYVTESGVSPSVSAPIELDLSAIQNQLTQYSSVGFSITDESEGHWIFALPSVLNESTCRQQYVYDTDAPNWVRWTIGVDAGGVEHGCYDPARQTLCWAVGSTLWQERRAFTGLDMQDPAGAFTSTFKLLPLTAGDPTTEKQWDEVLLSFKRAEFSSFSLGFDSEKANVTTTVTRPGPFVPAWGRFVWGRTPWGQTAKNFLARINQPQGVAQSVALGITISVTQAGVLWQLQGASIHYTPSTATPRR